MMVRISVVLISLLLFVPLTHAYTLMSTMKGEQIGDQFGSSVCTVDINGDGYPDLAVGAPSVATPGLSSGKVYVYFGGVSADTIADLVLSGVASSFFGTSVASAGDFNGDGYEDLLVGAPYYDLPATNAGGAYLFYGGSSPSTTAAHVFTGAAASDHFGAAVAGIGDINNDGKADIAIGAYGADWGSYTDAGKVYVYLGASSPTFSVYRTLVGGANGERFGSAITGGNFNGDSYSDVAVGAYSYDGSLVNQGRIYVFYGSVAPDSVSDVTISGGSSGLKFGWSLTKGRVTCDAYDDLIMGTDGYAVDTFSTGKVYLFAGGSSFDATADLTYSLERSKFDYLGYAVASGVDLGKDGYQEVVAGMPGASDSSSNAGGAVVLNSCALTLGASMICAADSEQAGSSVALWNKYLSDKGRGIAIGAPSYDSFRGRVRVYYGNVDSTSCCQGTRGNVNTVGIVDLSDLSALVSYLTAGGYVLPCNDAANVNGQGIVDLSDLSALVSYLTGGGYVLPSCT